jgi:hypothetical protein
MGKVRAKALEHLTNGRHSVVFAVVDIALLLLRIIRS